MAIVVAVANSKGGVGKTTISHQLALHLSEAAEVLAIDLDQQSSLTDVLNIDTPYPYSIVEVFQRTQKLEKVIVKASDRLSLAAGHSDLVTIESESHPFNSQFTLRDSLKPIQNQFDYVIIDTVGTASFLLLNALLAADAIIVPLRPQGTDLLALSKFLDFVGDVNTMPSVTPKKVALIANEYKQNSNHHQETIEALKDLGASVGYKVLSPIGSSSKVAEATYEHKFLSRLFKRNPRVSEYQKMAKEVKQWLRK